MTLSFDGCTPELSCNGGTVQLTAIGQGQYSYALNNNFDLGFAGSGWSASPAATFTNPCDPSVDGGTYMWMGDMTAAPRNLETNPLDVSCGGEICFYLDFATQGMHLHVRALICLLRECISNFQLMAEQRGQP